MCNETVRGLDSLEVEKKAFCAEVMSSNVDDLFSPLDHKAEAESTVPEPKLTHGVAGVAFERKIDSNPPIRSQSTNFSNMQRINN